ncbi:glutathione S-transferase family protein [Dyella mobilis]|uniref:Glutathione S-transferase family protein n=1 Tax=Dyella mobilis TaxID=1849582 RepID=A0ABS2KA19_9GAMM|nr:glutathione S-transferase family protein [Dyella mobilis]MBM7128042.1 glutathione S-transferase family protein [Dyella mobilis]GLR00065.1 glutathione S-transferase [Dyella mobilis]
MSRPVTIIGSYISPYVRKVLVCLELKRLDYVIDPIPPFVGNDQFSRLSPLRRVPVLIDGDLVLNDSSVICQYLEDKYPTPSLYPADIVCRAKARWLEEYADTRLADVLVWRLFYQLAIRRYLFGEATDEGIVQRAREVEIPSALDYLETQLPSDGFIFGELSIADISIACYFRTAAFVRYTVDAQKWPRVAAFVERLQGLPAFQKLARFEDCLLRIPHTQQRDVLAAAGAPLTRETMGTELARHGVARG